MCIRDSLILLGSADWLVRTIVQNREKLQDRYLIPYVSQETLDLVTDKENFGRLCVELGLGHPATVVHHVPAGGAPDAGGLRFPVIAKTADTAAYHEVGFTGKNKICTVDTPGELADLIERVRGSGYTGSCTIQDRV